MALPPLAELTLNAILDRYKGIIVQTAKARGIDLTNAEVEEFVEKLVGVKDWPAFRREHYTVLC